MKYKNICEGVFVDRPNRFIANVLIDGKEERVHVKNTGRCRELLPPGAKLWLEDFSHAEGTRKTKYDVIAVEKKVDGGTLMINMDSQAPNKVVEEALLNGALKLPGFATELSFVMREKTFGKSRFDLYVEGYDAEDPTKIKKAFVEVKGCTLEQNGVAMFPDAPTERGVKHIRELMETKTAGYEAAIVIVIQMKGVNVFRPNDMTHPQFGDALREANDAGVHILAYDCHVVPGVVELQDPVLVDLTKWA